MIYQNKGNLLIHEVLYFCSAMIDIETYKYELPEDRIAQVPLEKRDDSRLLVYKQGRIDHKRFTELPEQLPDDTFLFFNDTKVIPARIIFTKDSGASIEIFLLNPIEPSPIVATTMAAKGSSVWKCTIGNLKRWKDGTILNSQFATVSLEASLTDRNAGTVKFTWQGDHSFAEVVSNIGQVPLPPYLKRAPEKKDKTRYQTVYSRHEGAVAAPTAGLHFTDQIFEKLKQRNIEKDFLTLHVSAGTFQPVKVRDAEQHAMHAEQMVVTRQNLNNILQSKRIVAVGTTSMRTLESIYWYGVRLLNEGDCDFFIEQNKPYQRHEKMPTLHESVERILKFMDARETDSIIGETAIYIKPGYQFRACRGLITNFHQPGSTLILLVAAFVGEDWKKIYDEAIGNGYRFLSYGDSSLLLPAI